MVFIHQIVWKNRFRNWDGLAICLISVDGTDCPIEELYPFDRGIFSEKLNGPGYKYEVGVSRQTLNSSKWNRCKPSLQLPSKL